MATRGTNRLTRDNSGRITSVGGQGATARGGRLRTASGAKRGAVVARMSLQRGGVVGKPRGLKPGVLKGRGRVAVTYGRLGAGTKKMLDARASVLKEAFTSTGRRQRVLLGIAARQAESLSISGSGPNKKGRGNDQLTRAAKRAGANVVRLQSQMEGLPKGSKRSKLQKRLDKVSIAWMTLPKTRLPR